MKKFKWIIEVEVDETWVADGFDPDAEQFHDAINSHMLGYAYPEEIRVKVLEAPPKAKVRKAQGFKE